eukprot:1160535-Pelagomonas_calceolata.AAC.10
MKPRSSFSHTSQNDQQAENHHGCHRAAVTIRCLEAALLQHQEAEGSDSILAYTCRTSRGAKRY